MPRGVRAHPHLNDAFKAAPIDGRLDFDGAAPEDFYLFLVKTIRQLIRELGFKSVVPLA